MATPKLTRRELALTATLAAQSRAAKAAPQEAHKYSGALDGFETKVSMEAFDPIAYTLNRHHTAPLRMTFQAKSKREAEAWQVAFRAKVAELLGGFPADRTPLKARALQVIEVPEYRMEKFVITTRPGMMLLGAMLTPRGVTKPLPAVVCVPGHGRGIDDIIGVNTDGNIEATERNVHRDYAVQVVKQGLAAIAIEPMAFGCRRDAASKSKGPGTSACYPTAGSALLLGETMAGWRVYDVMRTIDWIGTRPELDASRVGCLGLSGGGTCTLFASALDTRIKAAYVSGYLNTFRDSIMSMPHCIDNYIPGILQWGEMYDIAGLIAPRPLFIESGERDPIFPLKGSNESYSRVSKVYEAFDAKDQTAREVFPGVHEFWGKLGLPWLKNKLG